MEEYFVGLIGQIRKAKEYYEGASDCVDWWERNNNEFLHGEMYVIGNEFTYMAVKDDLDHFEA